MLACSKIVLFLGLLTMRKIDNVYFQGKTCRKQ
jgi:hypothetical protein